MFRHLMNSLFETHFKYSIIIKLPKKNANEKVFKKDCFQSHGFLVVFLFTDYLAEETSCVESCSPFTFVSPPWILGL